MAEKRYVIRNKDTGLYYQVANSWVRDPRAATKYNDWAAEAINLLEHEQMVPMDLALMQYLTTQAIKRHKERSDVGDTP